MKPYFERGGIRIFHGDAREILSELEPVGGVWLFDPPYSSGGFQEAGRASGSIGKMGEDTKDDAIPFDRLSTRGYTNLMREVLRHSHEAQEFAIFTDWRMWTTTTDAMEYAGIGIRAMVVWAKPANGIGRPWRNSHELIAYGMRQKSSKDRIAKEANVIHSDRSGNVWHPTEKPLDLVSRILANCEGEIVVDPFMGSGTTLVAAKLAGLPAIGIEREERWCEAAANRLAQEVLPFAESIPAQTIRHPQAHGGGLAGWRG